MGTKRMLELCKEMPALVSLVHVSTAYANCQRRENQEVIYPLATNLEELLERLEGLEDKAVEALTQDMIENRPNTYTYTKAMAEVLISEERGKLPISIIRPSIVTATWKEPVAGWIDNVSGLTGFIAAWGQGVLRTAACIESKVVDLIPVDVLVNLILASAWHTANTSLTDIPVYNCCTGHQNPVMWGDLARVMNKSLIENPFCGAVWYPSMRLVCHPVWSRVNDILLHYLPAHLMDLWSWLYGKKRMGLKVYQSLKRAINTMQYFAKNEWVFPTHNMMGLYEKLSPKDKALFSFQIQDLDWTKYLDCYCLGVRGNILKQDASTIPEARSRLRKMYWAQNCMKFLVILLLLNFLYRTVQGLN
jgi:fatty acyl-CoA reductase